MEQLKIEIESLKARNRRVEKDKAWETSWTRRTLILALTYTVIVTFFFFAKLPEPFLNAIVPSMAFLLSTLSIDVVKKWWLKKH